MLNLKPATSGKICWKDRWKVGWERWIQNVQMLWPLRSPGHIILTMTWCWHGTIWWWCGIKVVCHFADVAFQNAKRTKGHISRKCWKKVITHSNNCWEHVMNVRGTLSNRQPVGWHYEAHRGVTMVTWCELHENIERVHNWNLEGTNWEHGEKQFPFELESVVYILRPTLDEAPGCNFLGTNLDSFESNWILELDYLYLGP